jgi:oligopeptide transport system ATP-binding protein
MTGASSPSTQPLAPLLEINGLCVTFVLGGVPYRAVDELSLVVGAGDAVGLVGESGSGKSVTARSILGLTDPRHIAGGEIRFAGADLVALGDSAWKRLRGREMTLIPQNALASMNPVFSVGWQIAELYRIHAGAKRREARERTIELMERVGIPAAGRRFDNYPHEFSGGMRQRAMIAMAVALNPSLVIADEPTTALDVTMEAQVIDLLEALRSDTGMALVHITHDIDLVASSVDRLVVMYAGRIVESGPADAVYHRPAHPYTQALLESRPALGGRRQSELRAIPGAPPKISSIPPGCPFHPRCPLCREGCDTIRPELRNVGPNRLAACHAADELLAGPPIAVVTSQDVGPAAAGSGGGA